MSLQITSLNMIQEGNSVKIKEILSTSSIKRRLLDIGFIEGTSVTCLLKSPLGDPIAYQIRGAIIALRKEDSQHILVEYDDEYEG